MSPYSSQRSSGAGDGQVVQTLLRILGEDVANELVDWFNAVDLTYRTDLRELNELNFARSMPSWSNGWPSCASPEWKQDLAALRVDLIRWMFGFWVTTLMALAGLLVALRGG